MDRKNALTINLNVKRCFNWKIAVLLGVAFVLGDLTGRISMANYQEKENEDGKEE